MVFRWKDDHTVLVLDLLKERECLWNIKYEHYRNRNMRDKSIEEMVNELNFPNLTPEDIKLKIKSIRTRYSSELTKILTSEKSGGDIYVPRLFWFKQADAFLRAVCTPRFSSLYKINTWKEADLENENSLTGPETGKNYSEDNAHEREQGKNEISSPVFVHYLESEKKKEDNPEKLQQRKAKGNCGVKRPISSEFQQVNGAIEKLRKISDSFRPQEDEFDFFAKSLAVQLRNMPLHRALVCQQKLQQVIMDERLFQLNMDAQSDTTRRFLRDSSTSSPHSSYSDQDYFHYIHDQQPAQKNLKADS